MKYLSFIFAFHSPFPPFLYTYYSIPVRISEPSYSREEVEKQGIALHEMYYHDGSSPPADIISK